MKQYWSSGIAVLFGLGTKRYTDWATAAMGTYLCKYFKCCYSKILTSIKLLFVKKDFQQTSNRTQEHSVIICLKRILRKHS